MSSSVDHTARDRVDLSVAQWAEQWPELDVSAMEVFGRLHRIFHLYEAEIARVFHEHGVNAAAFGVLAALYRSGPPYRLQVGDLAELTLVSTGGMTQRLDRLERLGLVVRERDRGDRRVVHATLTDAGHECAREVAEAHFTNERRLLHLLDPDQRGRLADILRLLERSVTTAAGSDLESL
jgi:DNA-binding MarR family transcriptional regulator